MYRLYVTQFGCMSHVHPRSFKTYVGACLMGVWYAMSWPSVDVKLQKKVGDGWMDA